MSTHVTFFVVYDNPSDYRGKFVVRRHFVMRTVDRTFVRVAIIPHAVVDTLEAARAAIPAGLTRLLRVPGDDPVIVETWL